MSRKVGKDARDTALNCVGLLVRVCERACLFVLGQEGYLVNFSTHGS